MTKKKCGRCQVVLEYSKFAKNKARRDGLQSHCKMCRKNIGKQHYQKHKADYRDRGKQWIKENPEKWKNYRRTWANNKYKNNPSFRVLCSVKATMYDALFRQKALREEGKTGVYLGCTIHHSHPLPAVQNFRPAFQFRDCEFYLSGEFVRKFVVIFIFRKCVRTTRQESVAELQLTAPESPES